MYRDFKRGDMLVKVKKKTKTTRIQHMIPVYFDN